MANEDGIFTRLGRMFDGGLSKLENSEVSALADLETRHANFELRDVAHMKQKEQEKPLFSHGLLADLEQAGVKALADLETKHANFELRDVEQMSQKKPLFSSVNPLSSSRKHHIHGGEAVHIAPKAPVTPSVPKAAKLREI